jgi:hypothetical protein
MDGSTRTRSRIALVTALSALLVVVQGILPAFADQPLMSRLDIDETETVVSMCDSPLVEHMEGTLKTSLYFNHGGQVTRITENWQDVRTTITNPANGRSVTSRNAGRDGFTFERDGGIKIYSQGVRGLITVPGRGAVFGEAGNTTVRVFPDGTVEMHTSGFQWDGDFSAVCYYLEGN